MPRMTQILPQWALEALNKFPRQPKGAAMSSCRKYQRPNQVNHPWYIPAVPTGEPDFGAPNCPVRSLGYYHRYMYMTEHLELMKGRSRLFIPFKGNNAGKELSAASISCCICTTLVDSWICSTKVDSHANLQNSKSIPGKVKAHEVCVVATSF